MEWLENYNKAFLNYSGNNLKRALSEFRVALDKCPADATDVSSDIMYHIGDCLVRLSHPGAGLTFWKAALRYISDEREAMKILEKINSYGMVKRLTDYEDDYNAFKSIQLKRFLKTKISMSFSNLTEKEMIISLIDKQFQELYQDSKFQILSCSSKLEIFRSFKIVFPFIVKDEIKESSNIIFYDFSRKIRLKAGVTCSCGSGLDYSMCCGSIPEFDMFLSDTN
ncbi:MAG: hypothetical protein JXR63_11355 [Spirochaetales bacterium]|nr:hypothetical protein [Spirochaetales bacterium]